MADDADPDERDIFDEARDVVEDSETLADDLETMYEHVSDTASARDIYERNPYAVLAAAAGAGYVLGGGLFTPFTKRVVKTGMKALVLPIAVSRLRELTQGDGADELDHLDDSDLEP